METNALRLRVNLAILLTFAAIAVIYSSILYPFEVRRREAVIEKIHLMLSSLIAQKKEDLANEIFAKQTEAVEASLKELLQVKGVLSVSIYDKTGKLFSSQGEPTVPALSLEEQQSLQTAPSLVEQTWNKHPVLIHTTRITVYTRLIGFAKLHYSLADVKKETRVTILIFGTLLFTILILMGVLLNILLGRFVIHPVDILQQNLESLKVLAESGRKISSFLEKEKLAKELLRALEHLSKRTEHGVYFQIGHQEYRLFAISELNEFPQIINLDIPDPVSGLHNAFTDDQVVLPIIATSGDMIHGYVVMPRHADMDHSRLFPLVESLLTTAAVTMENIAHLESLEHANQLKLEATRKNTRMEAELKTAAAVQRALFPRTLPHIDNLDLASFFQSASETGGDWYGFVTEIEGQLFILIGDVTGHGTPAALVTATASATCRTIEELYRLGQKHPSPAELLEHLNKTVFDAGAPDFLMTFFVACIDLASGKMKFSNAGHNFPLLIRNKTQHALLNRNHRLGWDQDARYQEDTIQLEAGDTLFFFTDGLIENENAEGTMWGKRELNRILKHHSQDPMQTLVDLIVEKMFSFTDGHPLEDDVTMVACRVLAPFPSPTTAD